MYFFSTQSEIDLYNIKLDMIKVFHQPTKNKANKPAVFHEQVRNEHRRLLKGHPDRNINLIEDATCGNRE